MSLNSFNSGKFLLTAGLLLVLAQGLWQLPELQDYLFPEKHLELNIRTAKLELLKTEKNLILLNKRVSYLQWFLAHNGPEQQISINRMLLFPFSEPLRCLSPKIFWHFNIFMAKQRQVGLERNLKYQDALLKNIKLNIESVLLHNNSETFSKKYPEFNMLQQIQKFQQQWSLYNNELKSLIEQLSWLEKDNYNN